MKIHIPQTTDGVGGISTFTRNLIRGLVASHVSLTYDMQDHADIVFVNTSRYTTRGLLSQKRSGAKVIQRLDGVSYRAHQGRLYPLHNFKLKLARRYLADHIVYQSEYSRLVCEKFLGHTKADSTIIYNGVDTDMFSPHGEKKSLRDNPTQKVLISTGVFRRPEQISPLIDAAKGVYQIYSNLKLVIVGPRTPLLKRLHTSLPFIQFIDTITHKELPCYLRAADLFLFSDRSACPNAIIEALAVGVPIVAFRKGAIPELIQDPGVGHIINYPSDDFFDVILPSDTEAMANVILKFITEDIQFSSPEKIAQYAQMHFSLDGMIKKYLEIFKKILI